MSEKNSGDDVELKLLGVIELAEAKRLRSLLEDRGVHLELVNNPETCSTGKCANGVEVYAHPLDLETVQQLFATERAQLYAGLDVDEKRLESVFDSEKATAICPACGTEFSTQQKECPDCGLVFSDA